MHKLQRFVALQAYFSSVHKLHLFVVLQYARALPRIFQVILYSVFAFFKRHTYLLAPFDYCTFPS